MPTAADAAVNLNCKTLLVNALSKFLVNGKTVFSNGARSLSRIPADCNILESLVLVDFVLSNEFFPKDFRSLETCISISNYLCGKLVSLESPFIFDERFKITSVIFFDSDYNLLSCEIENFTFTELD